MRRRGFAVVPVACALVASAAPSWSCTAKTGPVYPAGAMAIPPAFSLPSVSGLPPACAGQVYFVGSSALCETGPTYFLCDGNGYTDYDCSAPGEGWSEETLSQYDRVATDPGPCASAGSTKGAPAGTVYVEDNLLAPEQNVIFAFRYCGGTLPSTPVGRYATGGTGAADLYDRGILDADQQLMLDASQTHLFAVNQGSDTIAAFDVGSDGLLTAVAGSPFSSRGKAPASIGVSGDILVVANKASDGIRALGGQAPSYATLKIAANGSLQPTSPSPFALPKDSSPTQAFIAPGGTLVFGTEESGVLRGLRLSRAGELTLAPGSPMELPSSLFPNGRPNPVWPAGLSASPLSILYTGIPNANSIAAFTYTATGELSVIGSEYDPHTSNPSLPCWSIVSADGKRLYFADAGSDNISVWDISKEAGHPDLMQTYELPGGGNPWGLRIDPTGQLLFVITPRQVHQVPEGQGQLLHCLRIASDGTLDDEVDGAPVTIQAEPGTNLFGLAVVGRL